MECFQGAHTKTVFAFLMVVLVGQRVEVLKNLVKNVPHLKCDVHCVGGRWKCESEITRGCWIVGNVA